MSELSKEQMAEKAFEGLGGKWNTAPLNKWLIPAKPNKHMMVTTPDLMNIHSGIYAWPVNKYIGLIIEDANKRGWDIQKRGFNIYAEKINLSPDEDSIQTEWIKYKDNPMPAVVAAYCELLDIDARQGEAVKNG